MVALYEQTSCLGVWKFILGEYQMNICVLQNEVHGINVVPFRLMLARSLVSQSLVIF